MWMPMAVSPLINFNRILIYSQLTAPSNCLREKKINKWQSILNFHDTFLLISMLYRWLHTFIKKSSKMAHFHNLCTLRRRVCGNFFLFGANIFSFWILSHMLFKMRTVCRLTDFI